MSHQFSVFQLENGFLSLRHDKLNVIIMTSNYFVNISKLLEEKNKDFTEWLHLEESKKIIKVLDYAITNTGPMYLEESYGVCVSNVIIEIAANDSNKDRDVIAGFYIHRNLIPYVLSYISPSLSIKVTSMVDYYINKKIETKLKVNESINKRLIDLIDMNSEKHTKELCELKDKQNTIVTDLRTSLIKIKEYNQRIRDRLHDVEVTIMEYRNNFKIPKLIILQHKENDSMFKSLIVDSGECVIDKLDDIRNEYKLFFRTCGKSVISNFECLKKRLLRDKYICLQKSDGYRLVDKSKYYIIDMVRDLYCLISD
ncbi:SWPV1-186 [Shearwaterpox virus]|uniref:SWPV1-186 n=1 Tax=Shearwaterpox virus TaxID=1974596 RepID=A0A1V0S805_CNPV|nr:SWPV1-186 [Shearwaterpox virus]